MKRPTTVAEARKHVKAVTFRLSCIPPGTPGRFEPEFWVRRAEQWLAELEAEAAGAQPRKEIEA